MLPFCSTFGIVVDVLLFVEELAFVGFVGLFGFVLFVEVLMLVFLSRGFCSIFGLEPEFISDGFNGFMLLSSRIKSPPVLLAPGPTVFFESVPVLLVLLYETVLAVLLSIVSAFVFELAVFYFFIGVVNCYCSGTFLA